MVKDEACVMKDTLKPFVEAPENIKKGFGIFIFDTESTDSTMQIAEHYIKENFIEKS